MIQMEDSTSQVKQEILRLIAQCQTLELATASNEGIPCASYAPYVHGEEFTFYVFLSDLAQHTANISANSNVSAMVIEDESMSQNLFARNRLVLECTATRLDRNSDEFARWIKPYRERFGAIVDTMLQLADFNLYSLDPSRGVLVKGFGQAYRISGDSMNEIKHITNPAREIEKSKQ